MQISLHTGYYITGQMDTIQSFCGVSNSLRHDPVSVWAYLHHIFVKIKEEFTLVDMLDFFSDGPTSQLLEFSCRGHGKGIPDGIGAALKSSADVRLKHGSDIENTKDFVRQIKASGSRVYVYEIQEHDITSIESNILNKHLKTVPGTMKIHQVITNQPGEISHRLVSWTCKEKICNDHELSHFTFSSNADAEKSSRKDDNANDVQDNDVKSKQYTHKKDYVKVENEKEKVKPETTIEDDNDLRRREGKFRRCLKSLQSCQDFEELKSKCLDITSQIHNIEGHQRSNRCFMADLVSDKYTPNKQKENDKANKVRADRGCLPATGSVLAFGSDSHPIEIRTRIILEQVMHEDKYLDKQFLLRGFDNANDSAKTLIKGYAMYSDEFMHDRRLSDDVFKDIYRREIIKVTTEKTYMGIWQIHSLSSVLNMPIQSLYPELGNPLVRGHLHRMILPRIRKVDNGSARVLWTSTRFDMNNINWIPNHFVPVLPGEIQRSLDNEKENIEIRTTLRSF
ncbi:unnamed protein product [Mytilus coruscus]|uniref:Uncharacterized protein n=1 Tax=Mytilus coruscus TaxID=42192 RepID=A0A6J8A064_MYTCO|nr:unnamed protein product [Mytilus coruscus]